MEVIMHPELIDEPSWELHKSLGIVPFEVRQTLRELYDSKTHPLQLVPFRDDGTMIDHVSFGDVVDFEIDRCCEEVVNNPELRAHIFGV